MNQPFLSNWNTSAPFPYVHGGTRNWPVFRRPLPDGARVILTARRDGGTLGRGEVLEFSSLRVLINGRDRLEVVSAPGGPGIAFRLEIAIDTPGGASESQEVEVRPAPPDRPISYVSDFGDDLLMIFRDSTPTGFREIEKGAFDHFFRKLQAQGITRLITWLYPFPFIIDPDNYATEDWSRFEKQATAILDSRELTEAFEEAGKDVPWVWNRKQLEMRLMRDFGAMISDSAVDHGITLTVSYRPFEAAVTKFLNPVPAFDHAGVYLWSFLPLSTPAVNYHPDQTCFAHYRTVLSEMGIADSARLDRIEIPGVENGDEFVRRFRERGDNLRITAAAFPPLQEDCFVLQRREDDSFQVVRFGEIRSRVEAARHVVTGYDVECAEGGRVVIRGLEVPDDCGFLVLSNPSAAAEALDLSVREPAELYARDGTRLGRENQWWVLNDTAERRHKTRVAGITLDAVPVTDFFATEYSLEFLRGGPERRSLLGDALVIDRGAPWSVEMMDFNREAMRKTIVDELRTVLDYAAFDEIFINTRSHTQLAGNMGDGAEGIRSGAWYRDRDEKYFHLGIDLAYAPLDAGASARLRGLAGERAGVEALTTSQQGEWDGTCQAPDSPYAWRYARNEQVARGVRRLLVDLETAFPGVRIRAVTPERDRVYRAVRDEIAADAVREDIGQDVSIYGQLHGLDWFHYQWRRTDHIVALCEGMAMVDLSGTSVEPVFLGVRNTPAQGPLELFLRKCIEDMADNHGSAYRGPRGVFYESQDIFHWEDAAEGAQAREQIICHMLSLSPDIAEVILYESAAWIGRLDLSDAQAYGHGYLDRADEVLGELGIA